MSHGPDADTRRTSPSCNQSLSGLALSPTPRARFWVSWNGRRPRVGRGAARWFWVKGFRPRSTPRSGPGPPAKLSVRRRVPAGAARDGSGRGLVIVSPGSAAGARQGLQCRVRAHLLFVRWAPSVPELGRRARACMCAWVCTCVHCVCTCLCTYVHVRMHACACACTHACACSWTHVCACACARACVASAVNHSSRWQRDYGWCWWKGQPSLKPAL